MTNSQGSQSRSLKSSQDKKTSNRNNSSILYKKSLILTDESSRDSFDNDGPAQKSEVEFDDSNFSGERNWKSERDLNKSSKEKSKKNKVMGNKFKFKNL